MKINEITRPDTQKDADEILRNAGYRRLAYGSFGAVYEKGDKVVKTFSQIDTSYLKFIDMVKKSEYNPHFPMFYGNPLKITDDYFAIKQENLETYRGDPTAILYYIDHLIRERDGESRFYEEIEEIAYEYPRFIEACKMIADLVKKSPNMKMDIKSDNIMRRDNTIVFVDPVANRSYSEEERKKLPDIFLWDKKTKEEPKPQEEPKYDPKFDSILRKLEEDLNTWFDEEWVDISRKVGGKHPPCGASAGKGTRKKSSKSAYPKCVKKSKAQSMTKKEKESASRRKRETERKSTGSDINQVSTKVKK
jgi:hypothetical protein